MMHAGKGTIVSPQPSQGPRDRNNDCWDGWLGLWDSIDQWHPLDLSGARSTTCHVALCAVSRSGPSKSNRDRVRGTPLATVTGGGNGSSWCPLALVRRSIIIVPRSAIDLPGEKLIINRAQDLRTIQGIFQRAFEARSSQMSIRGTETEAIGITV